MNKKKCILPNGTNIYILSIEYFLATKFEAMSRRGGKDIRGSHDWEDIVYIMFNCAELPYIIKQCDNDFLVNICRNNIVKTVSLAAGLFRLFATNFQKYNELYS